MRMNKQQRIECNVNTFYEITLQNKIRKANIYKDIFNENQSFRKLFQASISQLNENHISIMLTQHFNELYVP